MENKITALPKGWKISQVTRKKGLSKGKIDVYVYSPNGKIFRSKKELSRHIQDHNLSINADDFYKPMKTSVTVSPELNSSVTSLSSRVSDGNEDPTVFNSSDLPVSASVLSSGTEVGAADESDLQFTDCDDEFDLSQTVLELSECVSQLKFEKEKTEKSMQALEQEAVEADLHSQQEIKELQNQITDLQGILKSKDQEICYFKNAISLQKVNVQVVNQEIPKISNECDKCTDKLSLLKNQINYLKKDNLTLMERITPCPLPDEALLEKFKENVTILKNIKVQHQEELLMYTEQIKEFSEAHTSLSIENNKLRRENFALKEELKELKEEKFAIARKTNDIPPMSKRHIPVTLSNRFEFLSQSECEISKADLPNSSKGKSMDSATKRKHISNKQQGQLCDFSTKLKPQKISNKTVQTKLNKVHVFSDSHGIDLALPLTALLPHRTETFVHASSGATVDRVLCNASTYIKKFTENDTVVIIAGANDFSQTSNLSFNLADRFEQFSLSHKHTNVVFVTQFHRHDLSSDDSVNNEVNRVNQELGIRKQIHLVDTTDFSRKLFGVKRGLHLNKFGKQVLCRRIADSVLDIHISRRKIIFEAQTNIKILEADMSNLIDQYKNNEEVAFAHCISADFENERKHMSQGVAVTFKDCFGKPHQSDYCAENLTYQRTEQGASVYSLVTKPKFFQNANNLTGYNTTYDRAFSQLTEDFKNRNLKVLICSPLGCIRDRVLPPHFARNLLQFRESTGASIFVIAKDTSKDNLCNGMPFRHFLRYLLLTLISRSPNTSDPTESCASDCPTTVTSSPSTDCPSTHPPSPLMACPLPDFSSSPTTCPPTARSPPPPPTRSLTEYPPLPPPSSPPHHQSTSNYTQPSISVDESSKSHDSIFLD